MTKDFYSRLCLVFLCILSCTGNADSQTDKISVELIPKKLFADYDNDLYIGIKSERRFDSAYISSLENFVSKVVVTSSKGSLVRIGSNTRNINYALRNLNQGDVTIKVFKNTTTGLKLLTAKTFAVTKRPRSTMADAHLAGCRRSPIPISAIRGAKKIDLPDSLKILSAVIYLTGPSYQSGPFIKEFANGEFDFETRKELERLQVGDVIVIDEIKVFYNGQVRQLPPMAFNVKADPKE